MARQTIQNANASLAIGDTTGYLTLPITPSPTGFSFGMWVKAGKRTGSSVSMLMSSNSAAFTNGFYFGRGVNRGDFEFVGYNTTNSVNPALRTGQVSDGVWAHVAVTYLPSGSCSIYLNGVLSQTVTATNTITTGTTSIYVGRRSYAAVFAGLNANQLVWHNTTTPWTAAQVQALYQQGTVPTGATAVYPLSEGAGSIAYDTSGNGNNGTITSGTWSRDTPTKTRKTVNNNMVYNGDFSIAPPTNVLQTAAYKWLDGTATGAANGGTTSPSIAVDRVFGIYYWDKGGSGGIMIDTTNQYNGKNSLKMSTTAVSSFVTAGMGDFNRDDYISVLPSTSYTYSFWMKTNYVSGDATSGAYMTIKPFNGQRTAGTSITTTPVKTTTDWTQYTGTFTTTSTTRWVAFLPFVNGNNGAATLIMDAWFADIQLYPTTPVTRSANTLARRPVDELVYNGDFEYAPAFTAATTTSARWIDGTAGGSNASDSPYRWGLITQTGTSRAQYDSTVAYMGSTSMKVSTLAANSAAEVVGIKDTTISSMRNAVPVLPNTSYTMTYYMKTGLTSGTSTLGARAAILERTGTGALALATNGTSIITTTDWTQYTITVTTGSTTRYITPRLSVTGNDGAGTLIMDAWFDNVSLKLTTPTGRSAA